LGDEVINEPMDLNSALKNLMKEVSRPSRSRTYKPIVKTSINPTKRLEKLKESLVDFQSELKSIINNSFPNTSDRLICGALLTQVDDMVNSLDELPKHTRYGPILESRGAEVLPTSMVLESLIRSREPLSVPEQSESEKTFSIYSRGKLGRDIFTNALEIEARIAHLENDVVGDSMSKVIPFPDLRNAIQFLLKRLNTVWRKPQKSDLIRSLNDKLSDPSRSLQEHAKDFAKEYMKGVVVIEREDPNNKKIDELYSKFKRGATKLDLLRGAVRRIDSLSSIHVCLSKIVSRVNAAVDEHSELMKSISSYGRTLRELGENLRRNEKQMLRNIEAINSRCSALEKI